MAGGGTALFKAAQKVRDNIEKTLKANKDVRFTHDEFRIGIEIVLSACATPLRQIAINAGIGDGMRVVEELKRREEDNAGINAVADVIIPDMMLAGIIDPLKVTRTALENAVSAAAILLTTRTKKASWPQSRRNGVLKTIKSRKTTFTAFPKNGSTELFFGISTYKMKFYLTKLMGMLYLYTEPPASRTVV